jgi:DNA invertase Pin-like site-specific DNA recombinase
LWTTTLRLGGRSQWPLSNGSEGKKPGGRPPSIPPVKREAAIAMRRDGMTPERIATALDISLSSVHRILREAKRQGDLA